MPIKYGWARSNDSSTTIYAVAVNGNAVSFLTYQNGAQQVRIMMQSAANIDRVYPYADGSSLYYYNGRSYKNSNSTDTTFDVVTIQANIDGQSTSITDGFNPIKVKNVIINRDPYSFNSQYKIIFSLDNGQTYNSVTMADSALAVTGYTDTSSQNIYFPQSISSFCVTDNNIYAYSYSYGISRHDLTGKMLSYNKPASNDSTKFNYYVNGVEANGYKQQSLYVVQGGGTNGKDKLYFANVNNNKVFVSQDNGQTWSEFTKPSGINDTNAIYVSSDGQTIMLASRLNLKTAISTDGGSTWTLSAGLGGSDNWSPNTGYAGPRIIKTNGKYILSFWQGNTTGTPRCLSSVDGVNWSNITNNYNYFTDPANIYAGYTIQYVNEYDTGVAELSDITLSNLSIQENSAAGTVIGSLATVGGQSPVSFSLTNGYGDNSSFAISGTNLVSSPSSSFNFESKSSYSIKIDATDATSTVFSKTFTISVLNVNENPTNITLSNLSVNENQLSGTTVGTLSTTDPDAGNTFMYSLSGTDAASFSITGNLLKTAASFDRETKSSMSISITSTDQNGLAFTKAFTISVNNVNEAPTNITLSASSIMENNAVNAVIGTLSVTDPDVGDSVVFSVISGGDKFDVSGTSLRAKVPFNYEAATSHSVTVRATDAGGLSYDKSFTISVTNDVSDDGVVLTESTSITLSDGKVYAEITVDPRTMPVTQADGSQLPEGSVLKNASTGQKYYKLSNSSATNFVAIELVPPQEWGWSEDAEAAWAVLQSF